MATARPLTRKQEQAQFVAEMMSGLGPVVVKPMFGGFGIYWQGLMFALLLDETLYFKVDDTSLSRFLARGLAPFSYVTKDGKKGSLRYFEAPPEVYDEREHMREWALLGFEAALRQQALKDAKAVKSAKAAKRTTGRSRPASMRRRNQPGARATPTFLHSPTWGQRARRCWPRQAFAPRRSCASWAPCGRLRAPRPCGRR